MKKILLIVFVTVICVHLYKNNSLTVVVNDKVVYTESVIQLSK